MEINITGPIGEWQDEDSKIVTDSASLAKALEGIKDDDVINVKINSPGGSVFEGFQMFNTLKSLKNKVTTEITGMAASIASLIALAGDEVKMSEVSMLMIHKASTMAMGNSEDLEKEKKVLESIDDTLTAVYAAKSGKSIEDISEMLSAETWMTSEEALAGGFVDEIINRVDAKVAAMFYLKDRKMSLKNFWNQLVNEDSVENVEAPTTDPVVEAPVNAEEEQEEGDTPPAETEEEEESKFATKEELDELKSQIAELAAKIDSSQEDVKAEAKKAVDELKTGLKRTSGQPAAGNNSVTDEPANGYVDKFAKFRAEQKELDAKTRN